MIRTAGGSKVRVVVWLLHLALPILGLLLLIIQPSMDMEWQDHTSHFWIVAAVALLNVALGVRINEEARKHEDTRLFLVSLAFLVSAGFLCLHALATPNVIIDGSNSGFELATPFGLTLAAAFAVLSSLSIGAEASRRVFRYQAFIRAALLVLMFVWGVISLGGIEPLATPLSERADGPLVIISVIGIAAYVLAMLRYFKLYRKRPDPILLAVITAFALLAEALLTVVVARSWKISWWEWHVLTAAGFGFVAYSAYLQYRARGATTGIFSGIALEHSLEQIRQEGAEALEQFITVLNSPTSTPAQLENAISKLQSHFGLTPQQVEQLRMTRLK